MNDQSRVRPGLVLLTSHWVSKLGLVLAITALSTFLFTLPSQMAGDQENPYKGVVIFLILPGVFFLGIGLGILGMLLARRRIGEQLSTVEDASRARQRLILFVAITVVGNLLLGSQLTYKAVHYMETPKFCGATCHAMRPEFVGHQDSSHASVACAECHVAPGQKGWIQSKMNGTRQLMETVANSYSRPVPSALESGLLVPSRETCERCHWAEKIVSSRLVVYPVYAADEKNTPSYTVLMMKVGGSRQPGIHNAHFAGGYEIRYAATDGKRSTIPWVEWKNTKTGETRTYLAEGTTPEKAAGLAKFEMQCVDCHNRPTHGFWMPSRALDREIALGHMPDNLPFVKREGLAALKASYADRADATRKIPAAIEGFYEKSYPEIFSTRRAEVTAAGKAVLAAYERNVFPEMKVTWGTYPNNLGHDDSPGCFRCHDGSHKTADGKAAISQDCETCHQVLAQEESSPEILKTLGLWNDIAALKRR